MHVFYDSDLGHTPAMIGETRAQEIRRMAREMGLSWTKFAEESGLASTTLTRVLGHPGEDEHPFSDATMAKLRARYRRGIIGRVTEAPIALAPAQAPLAAVGLPPESPLSADLLGLSWRIVANLRRRGVARTENDTVAALESIAEALAESYLRGLFQETKAE